MISHSYNFGTANLKYKWNILCLIMSVSCDQFFIFIFYAHGCSAHDILNLSYYFSIIYSISLIYLVYLKWDGLIDCESRRYGKMSAMFVTTTHPRSDMYWVSLFGQCVVCASCQGPGGSLKVSGPSQAASAGRLCACQWESTMILSRVTRVSVKRCFVHFPKGKGRGDENDNSLREGGGGLQYGGHSHSDLCLLDRDVQDHFFFKTDTITSTQPECSMITSNRCHRTFDTENLFETNDWSFQRNEFLFISDKRQNGHSAFRGLKCTVNSEIRIQ